MTTLFRKKVVALAMKILLVVIGKKYQKKSVDFMFFVCYYKKAFGEKNSLKK